MSLLLTNAKLIFIFQIYEIFKVCPIIPYKLNPFKQLLNLYYEYYYL